MYLQPMLKPELECGLWTWRQDWIVHVWSQICAKTKLDVDCDTCSLIFESHSQMGVNMNGSKSDSNAN